MALIQKIDGVTIDNRVRLTGGTTGGVAGWPSSAWYCEPMTAGVVIDDPLGELDLRGWHVYTADETADTAHPRIFTGWLQGMRISRGPYRSGPGRVWDCDIIDQNALFSFEVFRGTAPQRPDETDVARIQWAIGSDAMQGTPVFDNGRLSTASPLAIGTADFTTQYPVELFSTTAAWVKKNVYAYWDDATSQLSLHYDLIVNNPLSSVTISNVRSDVTGWTGGSVFAPEIDATMDRDPLEMATGVLFGYTGGYVYGRNAALIDDLSPTELSPVNFLRDTVQQSERVGKLTTANALLASTLSGLAAEKETITCTVRLPAERVNALHAGTSVRVRFQHLPGYDASLSDPAVVAVNRRTVRPAPGRRDLYDVDLELSNNGQTARGPGGGPPGVVPIPERCSSSDVALEDEQYGTTTESPLFTYSATLPSTPTAGHVLVAAWLSQNNSSPTTAMTGWNHRGQAHIVGLGGSAKFVSLFTKVSDGTETTAAMTCSLTSSSFRLYYQEWAGVDTVDVAATLEDEVNNPEAQITITPTAGRVAVLVGAFGISGHASGATVGGATLDHEFHSGATDTRNIVHLVVPSTSGAYTIGTTRTDATNCKTAAVAVALTCSGSGSGSIPPRTGSLIRGELVWTGDGVTTSGSTRWHYAPGSLDVFVDGVPIINGVTEDDPTTGAFSLDFAPKGVIGDTAAERVTANYMVLVG